MTEILKTVKDFISDIADIPFTAYYRMYVNEVQDKSIAREVEFLMCHNDVSTLSMIKVINSDIDRWA
jgi:hypothetical protein